MHGTAGMMESRRVLLVLQDMFYRFTASTLDEMQEEAADDEMLQVRAGGTKRHALRESASQHLHQPGNMRLNRSSGAAKLNPHMMVAGRGLGCPGGRH